jgi:hypothetical protein
MADRSWLIPGVTRVRHVEFPDSVGLFISRDGSWAIVRFDGDLFDSSVHADDLKPQEGQ